MDKIKNALTQLTTGKNKKVLIIVAIVFVAMLIFLSLKKNGAFGGPKIQEKDNTIQAEYAGIRKDEGLKNGSFSTEILTYYDEDYGDLELTITGQFYFRENHDKNYYVQHPYNKKEIIKTIQPMVNSVIAITLQEENYKYNNIRESLNNKKLVEQIKDQVALLDFTMEKIEISTIILTSESLNKIRNIEASKRPTVPSINENLDEGSTPNEGEVVQPENNENTPITDPTQNQPA